VIGGLVLAAGGSSRYGAPKQLAELAGRPLLEHALAAMAAAPVDRLVVVLGSRAREVLDAADLHGAKPVVADDWEEGQAASLRAGIRALADAEAAVVTLGDQPMISPAAIERVLAARTPKAQALRATYGGVPGHPVLLESVLFERLAALRGDAGAREVLAEVRVRDVPCDGLGRPDDVDTLEELEAMRDEARAIV